MPKLTPERTKKVFIPNDPNQAWVELIYLKPGVKEEISASARIVTANIGGDASLSPTVEFDRKKKRNIFFKEALKSWGGFQDQHANDLPCTPPVVELFCKEDAEFYNWLEEESDKFSAEVEAKEKAALGNS